MFFFLHPKTSPLNYTWQKNGDPLENRWPLWQTINANGHQIQMKSQFSTHTHTVCIYIFIYTHAIYMHINICKCLCIYMEVSIDAGNATWMGYNGKSLRIGGNVPQFQIFQETSISNYHGIYPFISNYSLLIINGYLQLQQCY